MLTRVQTPEDVYASIMSTPQQDKIKPIKLKYLLTDLCLYDACTTTGSVAGSVAGSAAPAPGASVYQLIGATQFMVVICSCVCVCVFASQ